MAYFADGYKIVIKGGYRTKRNSVKRLKLYFYSAVFIFVLSIISSSVSADSIFDKAKGTKGFVFNNIPVGSRYIALGGQGASLVDDGFAVYWNESALAGTSISGSSIAFMHNLWLYDMSMDYVGYIKRRGRHGVGVSVKYLNSGSIEGRSAATETYNSEKTYDLGAKFGYGYAAAKNMMIGAGLNLFFEKISGYSYASVSANISFKKKQFILPRLAVGGQLKNIGIYTKGDNPGIRFLTDASFELPYKIMMIAGIEVGADKFPEIKLGAEYNALRVLSIQAGMNSALEGRSALSLFSFGLSIKPIRNTVFSAAYKYGGILGNSMLGGKSNLTADISVEF